MACTVSSILFEWHEFTKGERNKLSAVHTYAGVAALRCAVRRVAAREIVTRCISTVAFTHTLLR